MMSGATVAARLALALMFAVAAAAKLADRDDARRTLRGFLVPGPLVAPLAVLVPLAELATAGALVASPTVAIGAGAALALLLAFTAAVAAALAGGRRVDCGCFGRLYSAMVTPRTLGRNAVLLALAGFVLARALTAPATDAAAWIATVPAAVLLTLANGALAWQLLRQNGRLWRRLHELEQRVGTGVAA